MYESDEQLSEALHKWVNRHKIKIVAFFAIILTIGLSLQSWESYTKTQNLAASNAFVKIIQELPNYNTQETSKKLRKIIKDYPSSVYSGLSHLILSKINKTDRITELTKMAQNKQPSLRDIANITLARIYIDNGNFDQAQKKLNDLSDNAKEYPTSVILMGDIYAHNHSYKMALEQYIKAKNTIINHPGWDEITHYINAKISNIQDLE